MPERIQKSPPYLFAELDKLLEAKQKQGISVINIAQGDPDIPTPDPIVETLIQESRRPENHRYPSYVGMKSLREDITRWMKKRFGVELDPDEEVLVLIGAKEGITHTLLAVVEKGDYVLVSDPCYPTYYPCVHFAEGRAIPLPLLPQHNFLPDLNSFRQNPVINHIRGILMNFPNNPTGAGADLAFFQKVVEFAREHNMWIIQDNAYSEIYYSEPSPSILNVEGAKECSVELFSFSKMFNMTGWRLGWICGNKEILSALYVVKTNTDSGVFNPIQAAGVSALQIWENWMPSLRAEYQRRKDYVVAQYRKMGLKPFEPQGTFYIWTPLPDSKQTSMDFVLKLLQDCNVLLSPGSGYGKYGEGYFRTALTQPMEKIEEAMKRLEKVV